MKKLILFVALLSAYSLQARECEGRMIVPSFSCLNPMNGADVRLYIMEYQTCEKGKIVELGRSVTGMNDGEAITESTISIEYASTRTKIDAERRVDNLTFLMPKVATMVMEGAVIDISVSEKSKIDSNGNFFFPGTFVVKKADGKEKKGKLICSVES